jgi:hypothetical protein
VLVVTNVDGVAGNEKLVLKGTLPFAAGVPATFDPVATGAQVVVRDPSDDSGSERFALSARDGDPIPPGPVGTGCGPRDGWKGRTYVNRSGRIDPPGCTQSAHGLRTLRFTDRRARGKGILFTIKTVRTTLLEGVPAGPLEATVVLGKDDADLLAGACGVTSFVPSHCVFGGTTYRCR